MTAVYFIRHAKPERAPGSALTDAEYPLSAQGLLDREKVTEFLSDKGIDAVLSSPFRRASETVSAFAESAGLPVTVMEDFRERAISDGWIEDFWTFAERQWADFTYKLPNGECLREVQDRNAAALKGVLERYRDKNVVIGTHGTALSLIIKYYSDSYSFDDFKTMAGKMPWGVKMMFDGQVFLGMETVELVVDYLSYHSQLRKTVGACGNFLSTPL